MDFRVFIVCLIMLYPIDADLGIIAILYLKAQNSREERMTLMDEGPDSRELGRSLLRGKRRMTLGEHFAAESRVSKLGLIYSDVRLKDPY